MVRNFNTGYLFSLFLPDFRYPHNTTMNAPTYDSSSFYKVISIFYFFFGQLLLFEFSNMNDVQNLGVSIILL